MGAYKCVAAVDFDVLGVPHDLYGLTDISVWNTVIVMLLTNAYMVCRSELDLFAIAEAMHDSWEFGHSWLLLIQVNFHARAASVGPVVVLIKQYP
jgi:hypothetical protein